MTQESLRICQRQQGLKWQCEKQTGGGFVVHHGHNLFPKVKGKVPEGLPPPAPQGSCWPGWRAGWHNGDGSLSPRAGWQLWGHGQSPTGTREMHRGLFSSTHRGGQLLRGQWCVLDCTKWNLVHCLWEHRVFSRLLQALNGLHRNDFF